ncbi:hypothetical protein [Salinispora arenicola]|uniref:hypothetical protein n=1 Tax=Salinispora arenicola TaxID=168697 RepID=UPI0027DC4673|nr:hypothetical protein [Salinispora arenicola]
MGSGQGLAGQQRGDLSDEHCHAASSTAEPVSQAHQQAVRGSEIEQGRAEDLAGGRVEFGGQLLDHRDGRLTRRASGSAPRPMNGT